MNKYEDNVGGKATPVDAGLLERVKQGVTYIMTSVAPNAWFGPSQPLAPISQESAGRTFDYPVGYNLNIQPRTYEPVSFPQMRGLADGYDLLRLVIETRKDQIAKMSWRIKAKEEDKTKAKAKQGTVDEITKFLAFPDKEHTWAAWLRMVLEEMMVIDACTIYPRMTKGKKIYGFEVMDGSTITRKLNTDGRTPIPPDPAYQQIIKGVPMADYSRDELIYYPRNSRAHKVYGYSPVEQIIITVNIALRRQIFQLNYYTEGNIPEALCNVPESWTSDQIKQFQVWWDSLIEGNLSARRHMKFIPGGVNLHETKAQALKDDYDEWLARIVCYAFSVSPTPFVKMMNRATAGSVQEAALQEGLLPIQLWVKDLMDMLIWKYMGEYDLEFAWQEDDEVSPSEQTDIIDKKLKNGTITLDEARELDGKDPYPNGIGAKPLLYTSSGAILLEEAIKPPEPIPESLKGFAGEPKKESQSEPKEGQEENPEGQEAGEGKEVEKLAKGKKKVIKPIPKNRAITKKAVSNLKTVMNLIFDEGKEAVRKLKGIGKADIDLEQKIKEILDQLDLSGWAVITDDIDEILKAITQDGVYQALLQIGMSDADMTSKMSDLALKYAKERSAELVGKRWVDGELIDNPNPSYSILESTREMLRSDIAQAIEEGWSNEKLADKLEENYAFSDERAEMIARTETAFADASGNMIAYKESGVVSGKEWILGSEHDIDDDCNENVDAGVIPLDEAFPSGDETAPAHPNCLLADTIISAGGISKHFKRWFEGEIIILSVTGMNDISITPNHPILTRRGWVNAGELTQSDNLVYCVNPRTLITSLYPDNYHVESRIEDVSGALLMTGSVFAGTMETASIDFHGDGMINGKVDIIRSASHLGDNTKTGSGQDIEKLKLINADTGGIVLNSNSSAAEIFKALLFPSDSIVSMGGIGRTLGGGHSGSADPMSIIGSPDSQSQFVKSVSQGRTVTSDTISDITCRLSSEICFVNIQNIQRREFIGHVYNLQTQDNYYIAQNLVVANCVCDVLPVLEEEE